MNTVYPLNLFVTFLPIPISSLFSIAFAIFGVWVALRFLRQFQSIAQSNERIAKALEEANRK